jgi:hypothetical protein
MQSLRKEWGTQIHLPTVSGELIFSMLALSPSLSQDPFSRDLNSASK